MKGLASAASASRMDAEVLASSALPSILLMEDASIRLWDALEPLASGLGAGSAGTLLAITGAGNNAGDALALMRHARFSGLRQLAVILGRDDPGESARLHLATLRALGVRILSWASERGACLSALEGSALVVDGVAGTGLHGALREPLASLVEAANAAKVPIAAIDLPSGLCDEAGPGFPLIHARWTLCVGAQKAPLYYPASRSACGEILSIGRVFPADARFKDTAVLLEEADLAPLAPAPGADAYKGSRGRVAVFAGSVGATGAAAMASRACLAAGAGYVALFATADVLPILASRLEAVMVKPAPAEAGAIDSERWDVLVAGPGWGLSGSNKAALARLLGSGMPAVLDADAIHLFRELHAEGFSPSAPLILTPHPGEFSSLSGFGIEEALANPPAVLLKTAAELGAVIALKSHVTWIASPDGRLAVWDGMESGLGTAGSGDVLAGIAGGLLASRIARASGTPGPDLAWEACCAAVVAHGLAGRRSRARLGWFEAGALIAEAAALLGGAKTSPA